MAWSGCLTLFIIGMSRKSVNSARVYRDMEIFTNRLFQLVDVFPKHYKSLMGDRVLNNALNSMSAIHAAYCFDDKESNIEKAIFYFEEVVIVLRLAHDLKVISHKQHSSLFEAIADIQEQLSNWLKYAKSTDDAS